MLVVRIEIHPGGDSSRKREIGRLEIANLSDLAAVSDYECTFFEQSTIPGEPMRRHDSFGVYDHKRSDGAWKLVLRALKGWLE
jgi:hypothetical protein